MGGPAGRSPPVYLVVRERGHRRARGRQRRLERRMGMLEHLRPRRLDAQGVRDRELIEDRTHSLEKRWGKGVFVVSGEGRDEADVHVVAAGLQGIFHFCNDGHSERYMNVYLRGVETLFLPPADNSLPNADSASLRQHWAGDGVFHIRAIILMTM